MIPTTHPDLEIGVSDILEIWGVKTSLGTLCQIIVCLDNIDCPDGGNNISVYCSVQVKYHSKSYDFTSLSFTTSLFPLAQFLLSKKNMNSFLHHSGIQVNTK